MAQRLPRPGADRVSVARPAAWLAPALGLALVVGCSDAGELRERPGTPPRSAVLITVEGLDAAYVSAYGHALPTTATESGGISVDRLAQEGVLLLGLRDGAPALALHASPFAAALAGAGIEAQLVSQSDSPLAGPNPGDAAEAPFSSVTAATAGEVVAAALSWLDEQPGGGRFLLWVNLVAGQELQGSDPARASAATARLHDDLLPLLRGLEQRELLDVAALALVGLPSRAVRAEAGRRYPFLLRHPASLTGRRAFDAPVGWGDLDATLAEWLRLEGVDTRRSLLRSLDGEQPFPSFEPAP